MENTNWAEEFENRFKDDILGYDDEAILAGYKLYEDIESFITDLLEQEKSKWLEALPKEKRFKDGDVRNASDFGWNTCLKEIKNNLK